MNNLDIITQISSSKDKIAVVLKDNAYGHGLLLIATLCKEYGITKAVVKNQKEALAIRKMFEYILVLSDIPNVASKNIIYAINDIAIIKKFPKNTQVEIKVNSGMNRNGVNIDELEDVFLQCHYQGLHVKGVFTHHGYADELGTQWFIQEQKFNKIKELSRLMALKYNITKLNFHSQNSAALFRANECMHDMIRVGIAAYGCLEKNITLYKKATDLKPVLSLFASKISLSILKKGTRVGYGGTFEALEDMHISTYDLGYGDGLMRAGSNIHKTSAGYKILGRISMDNFVANCIENEICIFDNAITYAKSCDTISYEILVGLKEYLTRIITD